MISIRVCFAAVPVAFILVACSGSSSAVGDVPTNDSGAGTDGTATDSAQATDTGSGGDTAVGEGGRDSGLGDSALTLDGNDGGGCPNTIGTYSLLAITEGAGAGCGDLDPTAKQCIKFGGTVGSTNACLIRFNSEQPGPGRAINGPAGGVDLLSDGTFSGAALREGTVNRTGCVGSFDQSTQTMTVNCGGMGDPVQSCTVTMVRSSATCP